MKKVKQSKKRWAWTESQKRRNWSRGSWYTPPSWFRADYHRANRAYERAEINKILNGHIDEDSYIGTKHHSSSAKWDW